MKILNLINAEKPFLMQQLDALEEHGCDIDIVSVPGSYRATGEGVDNRSIMDYARFYPKVLNQPLSEYDVIHSHFGLTAPFALTQPHRPVVMSLWGNDLFGEYGFVSKTCARFADAVIVRSEEMAQELPVDAHIVERGVDLDLFSPMDQQEAQTMVGWNPDDYHVLFPYAPSREKKNYPLAKEIIDDVNKTVDQKVTLHTVYNEPHDEIPIYMNASDVLLMTSKSEGSPNTVKEALACNLSVVSTDVGDVQNLLKNISNSKIGETKQDLIEYCSASLKNDKLSGGHEKMKNLSWDNTVKDILNIYRSVRHESELY